MKGNKNKEDTPGRRRAGSEALQYAGMAFQMGIIIGIGIFVGSWLDGRYTTENPYFTVAGAFLGLLLAFYLTLKPLMFPPPK